MAGHTILDASRPPLLDPARDLIREYGDSIMDIAACSLEHQGFANELATLPGVYAPPRGRLLVALAEVRPVGCVALRPIPAPLVPDPSACEMKRMYVRPEARGTGLGRALAVRIIAEARAAGYSVMKLDSDTDPRFNAAIALYRSLGFVDCPRYNADPDPRTIWMELRL